MKPNHKFADCELDLIDMKQSGNNNRKRKAYSKRIATKRSRKAANKMMFEEV